MTYTSFIDCKTINCQFTKDAAIARYGKVIYPTIQGMIASWIAHADTHGVTLSQCRIMKDDVESAFPQFDLEPESAMLLGIQVSEEHVFVHLTGMFGWTGCPMAFGCIGRAIERRLKKDSEAPSAMFADDVASLELQIRADAQQSLIHRVIGGTFPGGLSVPKICRPATAHPVLGWDCDLCTEMIRPNKGGCEKLLHTFMCFSTAVDHPLSEWQKVASLAERYSLAICGMRWAVSALNQGKVECEASHRGWFKVRPEAKFAIEVWRWISVILFLKPEALAVSMHHVARNEPEYPRERREGLGTWEIISDASPWKLCAVQRDSVTGTMMAWTTLDLPFDSGAFQNVREYLGLLLGLILLNHKQKENNETHGRHGVRWVGDNVAALKWARTNKVKSKAGQVSNLAVVWAQVYGNFEISETVHEAGTNMGEVDGATRDKVLTNLLPELFVDVQSSPGVMDLYQLCDPTNKEHTIDNFEAFEKVHAHLGAIFRGD